MQYSLMFRYEKRDGEWRIWSTKRKGDRGAGEDKGDEGEKGRVLPMPNAQICAIAFTNGNHNKQIHQSKFLMAYQNITASLSPADIQEIKAAFATIQAKMPFLVTLSVEERRKLFKMGDKSLAFVNTSLTAAQSNREILPASFDVDEFVRDYQLAATLTELLIGLRQLTEQVDDTLMAVGSEAMGSSLTVYDYVKTAAKKTPGLKTIAEQLGDRFKAIKNKPAKAASDL